MPKYYVESGQIKTVVIGTTSLDACVKAVRREISPDMETVDLKELFIVSEQGFASEKHDQEPDNRMCMDNIVIPIENVMRMV